MRHAFPLLWVALALAVFIEGAAAGSPYRPAVWTGGIDTRHVWVNLAGFGAFFGPYGCLAPAYTLSFELVFYALWGIAWFGTRRRPARAISLTIVLSVGLWAGLRRLLPYGGLIFSDFVLLLFQCWCIGVAMAFWLPKLSQLAWVRAIAPLRWMLLVSVICVGYYLAELPKLDATGTSAVYYITLSLAFALLTVGFVARSSYAAPTPLDQWLGNLSYPLYITHGPVIIGLATLYRSFGLSLPFGAYLMLLVVPALIVGSLFAQFVERPVMLLRRRARNRTRSSVLQGAPAAL